MNQSKPQKNRLNGACLCKAVTVSIDAKCDDMGVCHCPKCQIWSGSAFAEVECGTDVSFTGVENISTFQSSSWAERGFCRTCGTHLFIRDNRTDEYGIPPGLFEDKSNFKFNRQVFYDKKPALYDFQNDTVKINSDYIYKHFPETKE